MTATDIQVPAAVIAQGAELVPTDSLEQHPRNPRRGNVGAIVESIRANGFYAPLIVQLSRRRICAGNHRWLAARELGMPAVPVIWVDVDDDRALRILTVDNRSNDLAIYDDLALAEMLRDLRADTGTLAGTGFDDAALDEQLRALGIGIGEADFPALRTGDREAFQEITFILHDSQVELVKRAMTAANEQGPYDGSPNENRNGNALARIAETFLVEHGGNG